MPRNRESATRASDEKLLRGFAEKGTLEVKVADDRVKGEDGVERELLEIRMEFRRSESDLETIMIRYISNLNST